MRGTEAKALAAWHLECCQLPLQAGLRQDENCVFYDMVKPCDNEEEDKPMAWIMAYAGAVPTAKKAEYHAHATRMAEVFRKHGATRVIETWGASVPPGEVTSFPMAVKAGPDETVVMGWQEWPDQATQEAKFPEAMQDPAMSGMGAVPINGKTMIFAGFEVITDI